MSIEQAYRQLMIDENGEFSYIKNCLMKEVAKNKYSIYQNVCLLY